VPLDEIEVPTMFIVGSDDFEVLELNRISLRQMHCDKRLEIVEGATHLFEEVGAMQKVADLATNWFKRYLITQ
jgi:pimeloyl-ACP methyl ester carboxylesterase